MFKALFKLIINLLATVIQLICWPVNTLITNLLPDLSSKITQVTDTLNNVFNSITWALGLIPPVVTETILFILTIEIIKHTIYISTHTLVKVWNVLQKIKFW